MENYLNGTIDIILYY